MAVPTYDTLFNPTLAVLRQLGGSGSVSEMDDAVGKFLGLSENDLNQIHRGSYTELAYRSAWARNYLKRYGVVENSTRGIWAITAKGRDMTEVDKEEVKRFVKNQSKAERPRVADEEDGADAVSEDIKEWEEQLMVELMNLAPDAFERLCQRLLRESGFIQVEVTGRSGDGGIDGKGIIRIGGLLSFHIIFQCKRYSGSVSPSMVRDFRGAMVGRADKGLLLTTGTFTSAAKEEASREGAPPIDLVDGEQLVDKLKELNLGVKVATEELVTIDSEWFKAI